MERLKVRSDKLVEAVHTIPNRGLHHVKVTQYVIWARGDVAFLGALGTPRFPRQRVWTGHVLPAPIDFGHNF